MYGPAETCFGRILVSCRGGGGLPRPSGEASLEDVPAALAHSPTHSRAMSDFALHSAPLQTTKRQELRVEHRGKDQFFRTATLLPRADSKLHGEQGRYRIVRGAG